jgi:glycosyltransferase involved in cell wall biosynthesis
MKTGPDVVLDVTRLLGRLMRRRLPTGVDRVGQAYIEHYGARANALVRLGPYSRIFSRACSQRLFDLLLRFSPDHAQRARRLALQGIASSVGHAHGRGRLLLHTCHSGLHNDSSERAVVRHGLRPVFMVHDLIPLLHPEFCVPGEAARHQRRMARMLSLCKGIIANSHATLSDMWAFADARGLARAPSVVAHLAPAAPMQAAHVSQTPRHDNYFLALGTIEPRKNHLTLLHAWRRLAGTLGAATPQLVIVGQRGWESETVDDMLERSRMLQGHVTVLSSCTDARLAELLGGARALLFPSFAEGFGLPVVEALGGGVPVIASDLPAIREVAGAVPDYLDPLDALGWVARISDYARPDSIHREAQLKRLRAFDTPTWRNHFQRVDSFLEGLNASA